MASLDDDPLEIVRSRDGKRLFVILPYEIWLLDARTLSVQRSIELSSSRPSLAEDADGVLWIGGQHLFRASLWTTALDKIGARLGGYVDRVALLRPGLLCGVGHHGELLWDTESNKEIYRRKAREHHIFGLLPTLDERGLWCDGGESSWLINPARTSGYTQLRIPTTSAHAVESEGVVAIGQTNRGRCVLGARDGGIAWTHADLRLATERFPRASDDANWPLSLGGDERWIYVLRNRGLLQRFRIEDPRPQKRSDDRRRLGRLPTPAEDEPPPDPPAQQCRLDAPTSCMTLLGENGQTRLVIGGPRADGHLGRLWLVDPSTLDWSDLGLGKRELVPEPEATTPTAPSFVATRTRSKAPPLAKLKVDDVIGGEIPFWLIRDHANIADQPIMQAAADSILPADALLLPAMLRLASGTTRPGLVVLSATTTVSGDVPKPRCLTWATNLVDGSPRLAPAARAKLGTK